MIPENFKQKTKESWKEDLCNPLNNIGQSLRKIRQDLLRKVKKTRKRVRYSYFTRQWEIRIYRYFYQDQWSINSKFNQDINQTYIQTHHLERDVHFIPDPKFNLPLSTVLKCKVALRCDVIWILLVQQIYIIPERETFTKIYPRRLIS